MNNYYDRRRTTKKCSTSFHMQEVEKCIKLERFSYKMLYRSKNTFFDKMAEYGIKVLYYIFYLMHVLWFMKYEPIQLFSSLPKIFIPPVSNEHNAKT